MKARDHIRWSETLKEAVERCCSTDAGRYDIQAPWVRDGWTYATNGHMLVRLSEGVVIPDQVAEGKPEAGELVREHFERTSRWIDVPTAPLLDVLSEMEILPHYETTECPHCGNDVFTDRMNGWSWPLIIHQAIGLFGKRFGPAVIERLLDVARVCDAESVKCGVSHKWAKLEPTPFLIGSLEGLLMPCRFTGEKGEEEQSLVPVPGYSDFPASVEEVGRAD